MFDRFDLWRYSDNANCWDYVREFLIDRAGIPAEAVPRFGILPSDKRGMTKAHNMLKPKFVRCGPEQYAIACQYFGRVLVHVGVVDNGMVRHTSSKKGTTNQKISDFEKSPTVYYKYANA